MPGTEKKKEDATAAAAAAKKKKEEEAEKKKKPTLTVQQELKANLDLLVKANATRSQGPIRRVLRRTNRVRKQLPNADLLRFVEVYVSPEMPAKGLLLEGVNELSVTAKDATPGASDAVEAAAAGGGGDADAAVAAAAAGGGGAAADAVTTAAADGGIAAAAAAVAPLELTPLKASDGGVVHEIEVYLSNIVINNLLRDAQNHSAAALAEQVITHFSRFNKRGLDIFTSQTISFLSLAHQSLGTLSAIRPFLLKAHRSACLQHNEFGQATIINLLLRSYLNDNLYDQAAKLVAKVTFPEAVSANQYVRHLYYLGRIQCVQLEYTESYSNLNQAYRKAPQNTAVGFRTAVTKLSIIVQLLMGDIPERSLFSEPTTAQAVAPYLELTQAVRFGRLDVFNEVIGKFQSVFRRDGNFNLIQRLRQTVLKIGLRRINTSYSRISFVDIAAKLKLDSAEDAEYVCAKNIRDGVIKAQLDHDVGAMLSRDQADLYSTAEPQQSFHDRISFCLEMHDSAVKAMRYPPNAFRTNDGEDAVIEDVDVGEVVVDSDSDDE